MSVTDQSAPYAEEKTSWPEVLGLCARYWSRQKKVFGTILLIQIIQVCTDLIIPVASGLLVDRLIATINDGASFDPAFHALFVLTGATIAFQAIRWLRFHLWHAFVVKAMDQVLREAFAKVQRFSSDWHANTFAGATVRKLTRGKWAFDATTAIIWNNFFPVMVSIIGLTVLITMRFPMIGLMFILMVAVYIITAAIVATVYVRPCNEKAARADSSIGASMADAITNNPAIKAFGAEVREDARFEGMTSSWERLARSAWNRGADMFFVQKLIWAALQFMLIYAFIRMVEAGRATPGDVAFILTANSMIGAYLRAMGDHIRMLQQSTSEIADMVDIFRRPFQIADTDDAPQFQRGAGRLDFDRVTFAYSDGAAPLYNDFSISIAPGEKIGLVGPSGSGKSTFVKLIQRLYDVDAGEILIDNQAIDKVTQSSLRCAVALVPQDPHLFHRTLAENIAYARPDATMEEIRDAARKARASEFIDRLPLGYDTLVGERGVKLSGGERQRVAIARAFLADAPIVIFDEATSSLDTITEKYIQDAMAELMEGRTTIIIAHRLSTVRDVDRILVFDNGSIVEQGAHDELMRRPDGRYRELYEMQGDAALVG